MCHCCLGVGVEFRGLWGNIPYGVALGNRGLCSSLLWLWKMAWLWKPLWNGECGAGSQGIWRSLPGRKGGARQRGKRAKLEGIVRHVPLGHRLAKSSHTVMYEGRQRGKTRKRHGLFSIERGKP